MNCKEKKKTKGIKFGKNNLGGKEEKKFKKIGETGKNVIKTHFPGYKIKKICAPRKLPTRSSLLRKINDFRWVGGGDWND